MKIALLQLAVLEKNKEASGSWTAAGAGKRS